MPRPSTLVLGALVALALLGPAASTARATTWGEVKVACPLCEQENVFESPMSSGSYIYRWPSRYQLVFWPRTEGRSLWSCGGCRLTAFMWDFKDIEPTEQLRTSLAAVTSFTGGGYRKVPILERLDLAERVYSITGQELDDWATFHRTVGYHAAKLGQPARAAAARRKALDLTRASLTDPDLAPAAKEAHVTVACLQRLLGDPAGARATLDVAAPLKLTLPDPKRSENANAYLDELITALRGLLDSGDLSDDALAKSEREGDGH